MCEGTKDGRETLTTNSLQDTPDQDPQLHSNQYHASLQTIKSELKF